MVEKFLYSTLRTAYISFQTQQYTFQIKDFSLQVYVPWVSQQFESKRCLCVGVPNLEAARKVSTVSLTQGRSRLISVCYSNEYSRIIGSLFSCVPSLQKKIE